MGSDHVEMYRGLAANDCRKKCEDISCPFMLYDPVSFKDDGKSICDIYMTCRKVAVFYGGKYGSLYQRLPCAMGGTLFQEEAIKYPLPDAPSTFWKTVPGVHEMPPHPNDLPGAPSHHHRRSQTKRDYERTVPFLVNGVEYA